MGKTTYSYKFFFDNINHFLSTGRGFSVYKADQECLTAFSEQCSRKGYQSFPFNLSSPDELFSSIPETSKFVILIQDLSWEEFAGDAARIADRIVFPLWFKRIPVCFFSPLGRDVYKTGTIQGDNLHKDFSLVIKALLAEQVFNLLDRSNIQFPSPEYLDLPRQATLFTPVEDKLRMALEAHNLSYQPRARVGRHTADFLVEVQNSKVIVEVEGHPSRGKDKEWQWDGIPVCRFSASEIESDVEKCITAIREAIHYKSRPAYVLDDELDTSQQEAVQAVNGPIRVLAPAGSGKTKTLVNRILHLLNQGVAAERILALAFNKKARDEMQDRLDRRSVDGVEIRTFHSFGYEIVRDGLGWTFQGSAHRKTAKALMKSAILEHTELPPLRNKDPLDAFLAGLRKAKMELPLLSTETVEFGDKLYPLEPIFYSYLKKQLAASFLDFDDMIYLSIRLLLEDEPLRRRYQSRFEYVLVDEFQDLNEAQLLLLQIIGLPENNIFAVGDDDQMIYGFRGADVKHIVEFDKRFPVASSRVLNTNYRSSWMIVRHAGWLVDHNLDRVKKEIHPRKNAQYGSFEVSGHASLLEQAQYAANWLVEHKKKNKLNWRDYAILYRYNAYQFPIAVMLDTLSVPHSPASGQQLFQSMVGMDVYSYLQVILFPAEAKAQDFERILKRPNQFFTNQLISQARDWNSLRLLPELPGLRTWEREKLTAFIAKLDRFGESGRAGRMPAGSFLLALKTEFGLGEFYREQARQSDDLDQASDEALLDVIMALAENYKTPLEFFKFICKTLADRETNPEEGSANGSLEPGEVRDNEVFLSTIHRAKGKEFRNVIFFNLSQNEADAKQAHFIEEERRVAYVAATRPKDDLLITYSTNKPSEFLAEIALNPKYRGNETDDLERHLTSTRLDLERAQVNLNQLKATKEKAMASFHELAKDKTGEWPAWSHKLIWLIQNWRLQRAKRRIEKMDLRIRDFLRTRITPCSNEIEEIVEERDMRANLKGVD